MRQNCGNYPTGGHGYGFGPWFPYHNEMLANLGKWLDARPAKKEK